MLAVVLAAIVGGLPSAGTPGMGRISAFSASDGALPPGWVPLTFPKIASHTEYALVRDEATWVVRAG